MPWKVKGTDVYKKVNGKWVLEAKHPTRIKAIRHMRALYTNVHPGGHKKSPLERIMSK